MKKHILGVALFGLIVASFTVIFAFFYAPSVPPKEAVKPPVSQTETRPEKPYACQFNKNKVSYVVESSELDLRNDKFISKLRITWNGYGEAPWKIIVEPRVFAIENGEIAEAGSKDQTSTKVETTVIMPFKNDSNTSTVLLTFDNPIVGLVKNKNVYVTYNIKDGKTGNYLTQVNPSVAEANQVLINYGRK